MRNFDYLINGVFNARMNFCSVHSLKALVAENGDVRFTTRLDVSDGQGSLSVIFVKRSYQAISPGNISQLVDIHSSRGPALYGLYNTLKELWCPALLENPEMAEKIPSKIKQLLTDLSLSLGDAAKGVVDDSSEFIDINNVSNIHEPIDEINFWSRLKDDRRSNFKSLAKNVDRALSDIASPGFADLDTYELSSISDLIVSTLDALNGAFSAPSSDGMTFPQRRMEFFFDCIGSAICRFVQQKLKGVSVWSDHAGDVRMKLQEGIRVLEQWTDVPRKLTTHYWQHTENPWKGPGYEDQFSVSFQKRLEQIMNIRTTSDELSQLLTRDEKLSFRIGSLFEPLESTNPLMYNPYTEPAWASAVRQYESLIEPVESAVASHIRKNISHIQDKPQLLLQELKRYQNLLERPSVRRALSSEREMLLSLLREQLKKIEITIDRIEATGRDESDDEDAGNSVMAVAGRKGSRLLSGTVSCLVSLRQLGSRVTAILGTSRQLLSDLDSYSRLEDQCTTLIGRVRQEETARFRSWCEETQDKISGDSDSVKLQVSFRLKGVMMGWKNGALVVNFSDDLVRFLRDVRQLDDLGFQIPRSAGGRRGRGEAAAGIMDYAVEVEKFYRYGIILKKTANFYNSIAEQMIDVQEQLLLGGISKFLSVVSSSIESNGEAGMSWSSAAEVEHYIRKVQEAGELLSLENRSLRKLHESFITHTISLMNTDLLKQMDLWKQRWRAIRDKMESFKSRYKNDKDTRSWILHWDHQIYKALEFNYQNVLESLNENSAEIKVELIFSGRRLEFKPPMESIRQNYYSDMKRLVTTPNVFEGFGNTAVYRRMGPRNSRRLVQVFVKAEKLFEKLSSLIQKYTKYAQLGQISDLDSFIEVNVVTTEEFSANFKELRVRRKEAEKLPDFEKIDCCVVSLIPFKAYLDDLYSKINDSLLISLRRLLTSDFNEVHQFLESAREHLSAPPHSVAEISDAKKRWKEFDTKKDSMKILSKACVQKKTLLLQYAPGTGIDFQEVSVKMANLDGEGGRWDDFDISLEAYNDLIESQKEVFKGTIESDVIALNTEIDRMGSRWRQLKPSEVKSYEYDDVLKVFTEIDDWRKQFSVLETTAATLVDSCASFSMPKPRFDGLETLVEDLKTTTESWSTLKSYVEELTRIGDQDWLGFSVNVYSLLDFSTKWSEDLKASPIRDMISEYILSHTDKIKRSMPSLKYCQGEPFKDDHWTELLQNKLQLAKDVRAKNAKVSHFLSRLDILAEPSTLSFVKNLSARALGEVQIREALAELRLWELSEELSILTTVESGRRLPLIKDWKDLFITMGDKQSLLASLKESQFFHAFADQGEVLEQKMGVLDVVLSTLNMIQRKWLYLEPIFSRGALPSEKERFRRVDDEFSDIMLNASSDSKLFNLADERLFPKLGDKLKSMLDQLERCQKALTEFLEAKRSAMPRFYFIGDDDLLEILGQAKNPQVIQSHLKKLFQGINKVKITDDASQITAMVSSAGEVVPLESSIKITEKVEDWLEQLATEMRSTLGILLGRCLSSKTFSWSFPSQILCLSQQIKFTDEAEAAIEENSLDSLQKQLLAQLKKFTSLDMSAQPLEQLKMKALVMDLVHNIDVVDQLKRKKTSSTEQWQWKKQLRYYYENSKAIVKMSDAKFAYTYEYQGNAPKLVHTPLTDKCYLTLTQGMHMGFGGNPYGPAGTGKTESVKALAAAMGRQVLVFNCDEGIDFLSMGRIFIGLVKCGAWGCFDEFNRLKEDQLSAISQQIQVIQDAIKMKSSPVDLLGRSIDVDFNAGIFVTLNPAGKGYGGRSRLPDNLKALFRPVAMGVPDNELIAEVNLVTEGFSQSKDLASKIVSLFKLSKQLLSPQQHYDWGLRALKAVLNSGGRLIQSYKTTGEDVSPQREYEILIKAVRVNTLSKLTFADTSKFLALIGDVFPGVESSDIHGGDLEVAIRDIMTQKPFFLVEDAAQIKKMIQLKESLDQRMGCVVVGPSGCGKSVLWRVLKAAMTKLGEKVVAHVMNPKSMPRERLLGHMDLDTREWADGVLTDAARKVVREPPEVRCWIVCDGDVDPEWIESLNSVLDDNHLLTLPNGERISFGPNVNFLFETHDLKFASPATVSRMGMIFLSDEDLDIHRLIQRWLSTFPADHRVSMSGWIDEMFFKALEYVLRSELVVETTLVGTVMNGLSQIKGATSRQEFMCGLIRGIGGNLTPSARASLAKEIFQWVSERPPDIGAPLDCDADGSTFTQFQPASSMRNTDIRVSELGGTAVIPTVSVQRTLAAMDSWMNNMEPFLIVGPEGCGKSMIINHGFRTRRNVGIATINCNAQTTADDVISKIAQTCSLFSSPEGRVYRPRDCDRLVLYLKDINLPKPDIYDTCQLIAFLQQLITFDGFYNEELEFLKIEHIQVVASMNAATTVGRHPLSTRFTAVVRILVVDYPETNELITVYNNFLQTVLSSVAVSDKKWLISSESEKLAGMLIDIYQKTREKFTVDDRRHYLFTPRDVTIWVVNLCRYDLTSENLLDAVANEANRLFRDRLVGSEAIGRFDQQLASLLRSQYRHTISLQDVYFTSITSSRGSGGNTNKGGESKDDGGDAAHSHMGGRINRMSEEDFKKMVSQGLMYYEREERNIQMLLFPEALENICHTDRVLSTVGGHLMLIGQCGVGRRNSVIISSYMLGYEFYTPAISRDYGPKNFAVDLKVAMQVAGIKGDQIVFLIEDFQVTCEAILEIVNSVLSSGEVPGLYTHEELEPMLASIRELAREEGSSFRTPYEFFVSRVKKNLHISLCMDPGHPQFLYRCESNPALYSQCTVLWINEWRSNTLRLIPTLLDGINDLVGVKNGNGDEGKSGEEKDVRRGDGKEVETKRQDSFSDEVIKASDADRLLEMLISIHSSCVGMGGSAGSSATPRDFFAFLKAWHNLCIAKEEELRHELGHLEKGLNKLDSAAEVVHDLKTNAHQQEKDLRVAQAAADRAMDEISKALSSATDRRNEVADIRVSVTENEAKTQERKEAIEGELAEIQPILDSAKKAVGGIRPEHLTEIRSLAAPPEAIADVLAAVLMMLGVQDLSWLSMKKFLSNRGVKDDILNFDASTMRDDIRKNVSKLIKKKSSSFEAANIQRVSVAAAPMAAWVKANIRYSLVIEKIEPLREELRQEVAKLEQSQRRLNKCEEELQEIDDRVAQLKKDFGERTGEAERLKRNLSLAGETLDKAEGLIGQLSGEQLRWKSQAKQLRDDIAKLPTKMLLAAGFSIYLAKMPEDVRHSMLTQWQDITGLRVPFSFKRALSTESELLEWKAIGLPSDDLSQENGLVITHSRECVPFIIDPASAATDWLRAFLSKDKSRPLEIVTHHDPRFANQVELSVRFGKTLVILEADGVEPMLYPLCRKDLSHQGPRFVVSVGDKVVDYNENFQLFLVTRNPRPELPPDAAALVTQINFTVTRSGLEGQLLGLAIQNDLPELEKQKGELLKKEEDFKVQLAKLEKDLLQALATAEGNLLENTALIDSLSKTKEKSAEIEEALSQSAEASSQLDAQREVYRSFAHAGSRLFFLVKSLQAVNHMYQFSLASFLDIFRLTLAAPHKDSKERSERLLRLCYDLEIRTLHFVGRGLFKADVPMFALHLVKGMHEDHFQPKEWECFTGTLVASVIEGTPKGFPAWAASERQSAFRLLTEQLPHMIHALELDNASKWQRFTSSLEAERDFPAVRGVTPFQRVLVVQCFRPDRLQSALLHFCCEILRVESISPPPLSLQTLFGESKAITPILLISSAGADASKELQEFAAKTVGAGQYEELAMGGGQQDIAISMLGRAAQAGSWLCLKNLHLVVAWLPSLEKHISSLATHPDFRLWLTSEAHNQFPAILLQESLKATFESPPGLKMNLQRTFDSWGPDLFDSRNPLQSRLLFLLASFHAVMQERRTFIPQGWTKFYEFSYGDMKAGTFLIQGLAGQKGDIDWEAINGIMEDAIYGGRVDNVYDLRVLRAYLSLFFSDHIASDRGAGCEILSGTPLKMPSHVDFESFRRIIAQVYIILLDLSIFRIIHVSMFLAV